MVISFEEKDRATIEAKGMTIIEFKRQLYQIRDAYQVLSNDARCVLKAWNSFKKWLCEAVDNLKMVFEALKENYCLPTSFRYKAVKFLSRCTGIDIYKLWKMTRHTWLARSCC